MHVATKAFKYSSYIYFDKADLKNSKDSDFEEVTVMMPAAIQREQSEWEGSYWECSECGDVRTFECMDGPPFEDFNYCPKCGAKIVGHFPVYEHDQEDYEE